MMGDFTGNASITENLGCRHLPTRTIHLTWSSSSQSVHTLFFIEDDQQRSFPSETHHPGYLKWGVRGLRQKDHKLKNNLNKLVRVYLKVNSFKKCLRRQVKGRTYGKYVQSPQFDPQY